MKIINIIADLQALAQGEVEAMIPGPALARIKAIDAHPEFRVYTVGHEGESRGKLLDIGHVVKRWLKSAVQMLHDAVGEGVQLFKGHGVETNSTVGREPLGEVVGKRLVEEDGILSTQVATWIYPGAKDQAKSLDVCSVECTVSMERGPEGTIDVTGVAPVTAIALASSDGGLPPAFPQAGLVASMQMLAKGEGEDEMKTKADVRKAIAELDLKPTDIFDNNIILELDMVKDAKHDSEGYGKRQADRADKAEAELAKLNTGSVAKEDHDKVVRELGIIKARPVALEAAKEQKFNERELSFLDTRLDSFSPEALEGDGLKTEAKTFVEGVRGEFTKTAQIFDPDYKPGEGPAATDTGDPKPGSEEVKLDDVGDNPHSVY